MCSRSLPAQRQHRIRSSSRARLRLPRYKPICSARQSFALIKKLSSIVQKRRYSQPESLQRKTRNKQNVSRETFLVHNNAVTTKCLVIVEMLRNLTHRILQRMKKNLVLSFLFQTRRSRKRSTRTASLASCMKTTSHASRRNSWRSLSSRLSARERMPRSKQVPE